MHTSTLRHVRLSLSAMFGVALFFATSEEGTVSRLLIGWNGFALSFLLAVYVWMARQNRETFSSAYEKEDETAPIVLLVATVGALLSMLAIIALMVSIKRATDEDRVFRVGLAVLTIISSWVLVATKFTLHYANLFYSSKPHDRPLEFPGTSLPAFADFAYFSFTIAAVCQTSDVITRGTAIRTVVLAHTLVSFVFNLLILGFAINVTAGIFNGS